MILLSISRETGIEDRFEGDDAPAHIKLVAAVLRIKPAEVTERLRAGETVQTGFFDYRLEAGEGHG